jgi:hypothetical protein
MQGIIPPSKIGELRKKLFFAKNMETTTYGGGTLQILLLLAFLVPVIFFLITQQNTLKAIQPQNRKMSPGEVWLQLIPLFGLVWQFFVVTRISDSLRKEFNSWTDDSIFGVEGNEANSMGYPRPTYGIGLAMCICLCCTLFTNLGIPFLGLLASLGGLVCWIIYWVQLAQFKSKVQRRVY